MENQGAFAEYLKTYAADQQETESEGSIDAIAVRKSLGSKLLLSSRERCGSTAAIFRNWVVHDIHNIR